MQVYLRPSVKPEHLTGLGFHTYDDNDYWSDSETNINGVSVCVHIAMDTLKVSLRISNNATQQPPSHPSIPFESQREPTFSDQLCKVDDVEKLFRFDKDFEIPNIIFTLQSMNYVTYGHIGKE